MTIALGTARAAQLRAGGYNNNPVVLWQNVATTGNLSSANGVETDGAIANCLSGTTWDFCLPSVSSNTAALEMTGSGLRLDCVGIAAHNLGTLGATVQVQYSDNSGSSWTDAGAGSISPADDQAILWRFDSQAHDDWRLYISGISSGQPAIGVLVMGAELVFQRRLYQGYAPPITPNDITMQANISEGGHLLGSSVVRRGSTAQADLSIVSPSFLRSAAWTAFQEHFNDGGAFFWAWRPGKYGDCHWAWREGGVIAPENTGPAAFMGHQMAMRFYHDY